MAASLSAEAEVAPVKMPGRFRHLSQELASGDQAGTSAHLWDRGSQDSEWRLEWQGQGQSL